MSPGWATCILALPGPGISGAGADSSLSWPVWEGPEGEGGGEEGAGKDEKEEKRRTPGGERKRKRRRKG